MFKVIIVLVSLVWASLLFISWGGAYEPQAQNEQLAVTTTARS